MTPYYSDDLVTIYHGDAFDILEAESMDVDGADVIVTDPPYGIGMTSFLDNFTVSTGVVDAAPGRLAAVFMSPRRVIELATALPSWHFERLLWMHKNADIAAPWRGWCMNSEAILILSRTGAEWPAPQTFRSDTYSAGPWERAGHPNGKPLAVVTDLVGRLTTPGSVTLDPFVGSGTTLVAAKALGRKAIGIEIEERYCEVAARRCSQETLGLSA